VANFFYISPDFSTFKLRTGYLKDKTLGAQPEGATTRLKP
jgi:hypothetical protein